MGEWLHFVQMISKEQTCMGMRVNSLLESPSCWNHLSFLNDSSIEALGFAYLDVNPQCIHSVSAIPLSFPCRECSLLPTTQSKIFFCPSHYTKLGLYSACSQPHQNAAVNQEKKTWWIFLGIFRNQIQYQQRALLLHVKFLQKQHKTKSLLKRNVWVKLWYSSRQL